MAAEDRKDFETLVREGYLLLPEWVRRKMSNVALLVEDRPSRGVRREQGLGSGETLLGYYRGTPLTARGSDYGVGATLPDTITLYRKPIEEEAGGDPEEVKRVVAETVWHEVAHHFGMDEDAIEEREREVKKRADDRLLP